MDKEDVVHIYSGILVRKKNKMMPFAATDMDGHRDCHTEWSKFKTVKQPYWDSGNEAKVFHKLRRGYVQWQV